MGGIGCGFSIAAGVFAALGLIPFLGWVNWFTTLPAALLAILVSFVAMVRHGERGNAVLGLIVGVLVFFWAIFRLGVGGGVI